MTKFTRKDLNDAMKAIVSNIRYIEAPLRYGPNEFIVIIPALRRLMPDETFPIAFPVREKKRADMDITIYDDFYNFKIETLQKGRHAIPKKPDGSRSGIISFVYYWIRKDKEVTTCERSED